MEVNGVEGIVITQCHKDENTTAYKTRVSTDQQNWLWVNASSTQTVKVLNAPTGVQIYVQMQLENAYGFSPWNDAVTGMIPTQNLIASVHE